MRASNRGWEFAQLVYWSHFQRLGTGLDYALMVCGFVREPRLWAVTFN